MVMFTEPSLFDNVEETDLEVWPHNWAINVKEKLENLENFDATALLENTSTGSYSIFDRVSYVH